MDQKLIKLYRLLISKIRGEYNLDSLIKRGLQIGKNFHMERGCIIDESFCWLISFGDSVTLAPNVHILAHDASTKMFLGYTKIGKVSIGNNVFIGAGTIILPNIHIGDRVIIGAGSIVSRDIPSNSVVAGNPAHIIINIDDYLAKHTRLLATNPSYDITWTYGRTNAIKQAIMKQELENRIGYIE